MKLDDVENLLYLFIKDNISFSKLRDPVEFAKDWKSIWPGVKVPEISHGNHRQKIADFAFKTRQLVLSHFAEKDVTLITDKGRIWFRRGQGPAGRTSWFDQLVEPAGPPSSDFDPLVRPAPFSPFTIVIKPGRTLVGNLGAGCKLVGNLSWFEPAPKLITAGRKLVPLGHVKKYPLDSAGPTSPGPDQQTRSEVGCWFDQTGPGPVVLVHP